MSLTIKPTGNAHARASAVLTRAMRRDQAKIEERSKVRRHHLRLANDEGVTYAQLAELNEIAESAIGDAIARARAEVDAGEAPKGF